jgi:hypothetical protein
MPDNGRISGSLRSRSETMRDRPQEPSARWDGARARDIGGCGSDRESADGR